MFDRNDAFSMEIRDPDTKDDVTPILRTLAINDDLLLFKTSGIYRMLTAETLDPTAVHLDTKHSYEKLYPIGTSSPYVSRLILQFEDIINLAVEGNSSKTEVTSYLWNVNKLLLDCYVVANEISRQMQPLFVECNEIIEANKKQGVIPPLPKVINLENHVRSFLNNSKLFLIEAFKVLNIFFNMPITDRSLANFTKHAEWIESDLGSEHPISKVLKQDIDWIRTLSECRNAMEHPDVGQRLYIDNFKLQPGNKFSQPSWAYDLTKKLGIKTDYTDLISDLDVYIHNMFSFFEELMLLVMSDKLKENKLMALCRISDEDIDKECPICYRVTLKETTG